MDKHTDYTNAFLNGDSTVLQDLYSKCYPEIERYIVKHQGGKPEAEDIFQNALVLLYVKLKKEKLQIQSFEKYLFTICKNMWRRKAKLKKRVTNTDVIPLIDESNELASFYQEQKQWDLFQEKFKELSDPCKKILEMIFKKETYEEIVTYFGYASHTVARQRVFKCKSRLIQLIKKDKRYQQLKK